MFDMFRQVLSIYLLFLITPRKTYIRVIRKSSSLELLFSSFQCSLTVRGGYVPENCREWQNRER